MTKILVVDDEQLIAEMIEAALSEEGYSINKAYSGEEALAMVEQDPPDLVLLDLMLPGMDGYEVSRLMQKDARYSHIPVIMLTAKSATADRAAGYERGADDYITKPFDMDELIIRVQAQLRHREPRLESSLTGLPGSEAAQMAIEERTSDSTQEWTIIYVEVENFTSYSEAYTFTKGNEMIRQVAQCLKQAVTENGRAQDFTGHLGGDSFVILTVPPLSQSICNRAFNLFSQTLPTFFNAAERANSFFYSINHRGERVKLPLVSLSFDVVDNFPSGQE